VVSFQPTETNPKEQSNIITTKSGKIAEEGDDDKLVDEKERKNETKREMRWRGRRIGLRRKKRKKTAK